MPRLPPSSLCSTSIRISSGEWTRSWPVGALMRKSRSTALAVPLSRRIGHAMSQENPISGITTQPLTDSGKSRATALGASSPRTMWSTVMMEKAMTTATEWVA